MTILNPCMNMSPIKGKPNFFLADKPVKVFKKLHSGCIANLVIPQGAMIRVSAVSSTGIPAGKSRASMALCHSIVQELSSRIKDSVPSAVGYYQTSFMYNANPSLVSYYLENPEHFPLPLLRTMAKTPKSGIAVPSHFSMVNKECEAGIHFFFSLKEAQNFRG